MYDDPRAATEFDARKFLAWVKTRDRSRTFDYANPRRCAIVQFLEHIHPGEGVGCNSITGRVWGADGRVTHRYLIPSWVDDVFHHPTHATTFGEITDRLKVAVLERAGLIPA
jgi:hypothetical protein